MIALNWTLFTAEDILAVMTSKSTKTFKPSYWMA